MSASSDLSAPLLASDAGGVDSLKAQLEGIQTKLATALTHIHPDNTPPNADVAGYVQVEYVKTKPSKFSRKKDQKVKTILHEFIAEFPEGSVTALMGPSGAGKTTLLDFVTGMLGKSVVASGQVCLPDNDAYVPQDDRLHGFYTCQAYMEHYARLSEMKKLCDCCEKKTSSLKDIDDDTDEEEPNLSSSTDDLIAHILDEVGLTAQKNTPVGGLFKRGLSGGQKRRLSVALEALSDPMNLFLDEPTSGLDSESALRLMQYLQTYARKVDPVTGKRHRVIITIHQPSSRIWELIDNVVLLAQGRLMYQGRRTLMESFFASCGHPVPLNFNPADHFIEALSEFPASGSAQEDRGNKSKEEMWSEDFLLWSSRDTASSRKLAGSVRRNTVVRVDPQKHLEGKKGRKNTVAAIELARRAFSNLIKNPIILGLRIIISGGLSLFIGVLFYNLTEKTDFYSVVMSRSALIYFILTFVSSMSIAGLPFAMTERGIVDKEVRNKRFHPVFYHLSQVLVSLPVCLLLSLIVWGIILGMTGLGGEHWGTIQSLTILYRVMLCADATVMFVGYIAPNLIGALCLATGIFGMMTIVMGFLILPSDMAVWIRWLNYVPFLKYGFEASMCIQFDGKELLITDFPGGLTLENGYGVRVPGSAFIQMFEIECDPVKDDWILIVWCVCMHLVSVIYLLWSHHRAKRIFVYSDK